MEKELQKMHPTCCNLLKGQDFFANSLSILLNNFSEGIHKFKGKHEHDDKKC